MFQKFLKKLNENQSCGISELLTAEYKSRNLIEGKTEYILHVKKVIKSKILALECIMRARDEVIVSIEIFNKYVKICTEKDVLKSEHVAMVKDFQARAAVFSQLVEESIKDPDAPSKENEPANFLADHSKVLMRMKKEREYAMRNVQHLTSVVTQVLEAPRGLHSGVIQRLPQINQRVDRIEQVIQRNNSNNNLPLIGLSAFLFAASFSTPEESNTIRLILNTLLVLCLLKLAFNKFSSPEQKPSISPTENNDDSNDKFKMRM